MAIHKKRQDIVLDLGEDITAEEVELSNQLFSLLFNTKKVVAARVLFKKQKELFLEFDDGTRLFVNNFHDKYDISVT